MLSIVIFPSHSRVVALFIVGHDIWRRLLSISCFEGHVRLLVGPSHQHVSVVSDWLLVPGRPAPQQLAVHRR